MKRIVITGACRTPIGKMGGSLSNISIAELGAVVIRETLRRSRVSPDMVSQVIMGCVLQAGHGQNVARQAAITAGLPVEVPAQTLNIVCGSGLNSINMGAALIAAGQADIVVAGGMEIMSAAPYALDKARFGYRLNHGTLIDTMVHDGLWDAFNQYHMGITAENLAQRYGITRGMQDEFALNSQHKCQLARQEGKFEDEIVPVIINDEKNREIIVDKDECPRNDLKIENLEKLKPVFKKDGTVTAGNASPISDGAAAVTLMSEDKARELGVTPMAIWRDYAIAGVDPSIMGIAPAYSTKKLLEKNDLTLEDIDLIEANEAFAAQAIAVGKELNWDMSKINVNGGALALGHPIGASGCRILVTLLHEMKRRKSRFGIGALCIGGGMGISTLVECIH